MASPLLTTKLVVPPATHSRVARPRLLAALDEVPRRALTLVCAPAGYGKTTLLAEWVSGQAGRLHVGWVALEEADNDPAQFVGYVQAALSSLPADMDRTPASPPSFPLPPLPAILTALINDLHRFGAPAVLVLDDYQCVSNLAIHEGLAFFVDHLPPNAHLVIATRSDPPLPLARLRARGQLAEIRAEDLRFSLDEAAQLLNQVVGLELEAQDVTRLEQRTEGWAAGLQMAALALKSVLQTRPSEVAAYVANFSGTHRYVFDYLAEEVFRQQPESLQAFLLQTSILESLCGPLCDAVIGRSPDRAGLELPASQQVLEALERDNLFLMPQDAQRRWYRYHHLFADLLRSRLEQQFPQQVSALHIRASQWYEREGLLVEAITQALACPDRTYAADLLERQSLTFYFRGEITLVLRWLDGLPRPLMLGRALLCAVRAAASALLPPYPPHSLPAAEEWMQAAERALSPGGQDGALAQVFIQCIRSYWARFRGEPPEQVTQLILNALDRLPPDPGAAPDRNRLCIRSALQTNLAWTYWTAGDEAAAEQAFVQARQTSRAAGDLFNEAGSVSSLVRIRVLHGQLDAAARLCREALASFDGQPGQLGRRGPYSGEIGVHLAEILIEQNQLAEVDHLLEENLELARWTASHNILIRGHLALARLAALRGEAAAAFEQLDEAGRVSPAGHDLAGAQRVSLWLALGSRHPEYIDLARAWGQSRTLAEFRPGPPDPAWTISLAVARLRLTEASLLPAGPARDARLGEVWAWLERQKHAMQGRGRAYWEILLGLIECLGRERAGDRRGSMQALRQVLELAAPGGFVQVFVEEGALMQRLLQAYLAGPAPVHQPHVQRLLACFVPVDQPAPPDTQASDLAEPLTARELEILHGLAEGYSNREIAERLILAEGTVKFYVHSLLEKLGVQNRTQAVMEARRHKLL